MMSPTPATRKTSCNSISTPPCVRQYMSLVQKIDQTLEKGLENVNLDDSFIKGNTNF